LVLDIGTYAAAMGVFAAVTCYRANPVRAVNRFLAVFLLIAGLWQLFVALARVTREFVLWGTICMPISAVLLVQLFLVHDACLAPGAPLSQRLRRHRLTWLAAVALLLGVLLTPPNIILPDIYPWMFRAVATVALVAALIDGGRRHRAAHVVNSYEALLLHSTLVAFTVTCGVFLLAPPILRSRVNSVVALVYVSTVFALLLTERVFDVAGTAKIAVGHIVRLGMTVLLLLAVVETFHTLIPIDRANIWPLTVLLGLILYPVTAVTCWVTHRYFNPYTDSDAVTREAILEVLGAGGSESEIVQRTERFARGHLGGLDVAVTIATSPPARWSADRRLGLAAEVQGAWLSPETAVRTLRGAHLDRVLEWFVAERLGAVVRYAGRKVSVLVYVGQRRGGTKPILTAELELLHELATIAGTSIDRLRAADENIRDRHLALVGRLAADFSHSARNQISAIETLVEAVKDGRESDLSEEYRRAVYEETLALANNHDLALAITRLEPGKREVMTLPVLPLLNRVAATYGPIAERARGRIQLLVQDESLAIQADERLLRQVLLNLLRNSLQACAAVFAPPHVEIRAAADGDSVQIDVIDTGPGVPVEVYDRLFTPWATTKADGTGLGLAFCLQAMKAVGGEVEYVRPRGEPHAWFRLRLPRPRADAATPNGNTMMATP
jgi:signal transduction histidine kinase